MAEYLELFNAQNFSLQQTKLRRHVHEDGDWHRTSQVYILNDKQELLCNLRNPDKDVFPLLWDISIGGHLSPGESYEECAKRELEEELGIDVNAADLQYMDCISIDGKDEINKLTDREHAGIFLYVCNLSKESFHFQLDEIVELQYFSLPFIKENLQSTHPAVPFIPLQAKFLEIIALIEENI